MHACIHLIESCEMTLEMTYVTAVIKLNWNLQKLVQDVTLGKQTVSLVLMCLIEMMIIKYNTKNIYIKLGQNPLGFRKIVAIMS